MGPESSTPIRPKTFARNHTIPQKVTDVSIYNKGPEKSRLRKLRPLDRARWRRARGGCSCALYGVPGPPGVVMVAPPEAPRNAKAAPDRGVKRGQGQYKGRVVEGWGRTTRPRV